MDSQRSPPHDATMSNGFATLPGNVRGAILMSLGAVLFAVEVLFIRWMNDRGIGRC